MKTICGSAAGLLFVVLLLLWGAPSAARADILPTPLPSLPVTLPLPNLTPQPVPTRLIPGPVQTVIRTSPSPVYITHTRVVTRPGPTKTVIVTKTIPVPGPTHTVIKTIQVPGPTKTVIQQKFTPQQKVIIRREIRKQQIKFGLAGVLAGMLIAFVALSLVYIRAFRKGELHDARILQRSL